MELARIVKLLDDCLPSEIAEPWAAHIARNLIDAGVLPSSADNPAAVETRWCFAHNFIAVGGEDECRAYLLQTPPRITCDIANARVLRAAETGERPQV